MKNTLKPATIEFLNSLQARIDTKADENEAFHNARTGNMDQKTRHILHTVVALSDGGPGYYDEATAVMEELLPSDTHAPR